MDEWRWINGEYQPIPTHPRCITRSCLYCIPSVSAPVITTAINCNTHSQSHHRPQPQISAPHASSWPQTGTQQCHRAREPEQHTTTPTPGTAPHTAVPGSPSAHPLPISGPTTPGSSPHPHPSIHPSILRTHGCISYCVASYLYHQQRIAAPDGMDATSACVVFGRAAAAAPVTTAAKRQWKHTRHIRPTRH